MRIVIATANQGKVREIKRILSSTRHTFVSLDDLSAKIDVTEDGLTFEENALKKAGAVSRMTGLPAISDDSGLEVAALNGEPGIHTARFGGKGISDRERYLFLLEEMDAIPADKRGARFVCVAAFVDFETGRKETFRGECIGEILSAPRGDSGFGYDPVFYITALEKTFSELDGETKNSISHRALAFNKASDFLKNIPGP